MISIFSTGNSGFMNFYFRKEVFHGTVYRTEIYTHYINKICIAVYDYDGFHVMLYHY